MSKLIKINEEYAGWIKDLSLRFRQSQIKAAVKVNGELLKFYWELGRDIVEKQVESKWGEGFFKNLSMDLQEALPGVKGLSIQNLYYTKKFYLLYCQSNKYFPQLVEELQKAGDSSIFPQAVGKLKEMGKSSSSSLFSEILEELLQIPWGHHRYIIDKCNDNPSKAFFYVRQTIANNWSRAMLLNFLDTNLYERQGNAVTNFKTTLPAVNSDLAQQLTKDPYCFDFVSLTEPFKEKELKDALLHNITKFLLELGNGFAFMGNEYRLKVGETEQFLDLLFYNVNLKAYVVVEVKTTAFEPAQLGQLSSYVSCVNHLLRKSDDNATIGLLVCKDKDNVFAQYSLEGYNQPLGISEFKVDEIFPKDFKSTLPSIEDIERELS
jgi:predicted nuclease of restriction endonuclease-like (RecB) superfamily